jgi:hypothetical protein
MPASNTASQFSTPRTYRFTPYQAFELDKTRRLLGITESELVRTLLKQGIEKIWEGR